MVEGISKEILDMLSYRSAPGQSLKQISLREPPLDLVLDDIAKYHSRVPCLSLPNAERGPLSAGNIGGPAGGRCPNRYLGFSGDLFGICTLFLY